MKGTRTGWEQLHWGKIIIAFLDRFVQKYKITYSTYAGWILLTCITFPYIPTFPIHTQRQVAYKAASIATPAATKLPAPATSWPAAPVEEGAAEEAADDPAPEADEAAEEAAEAIDEASGFELVAEAEVLAALETEAAVEEAPDEDPVLDGAVVETGPEDDAEPEEAAVELAPPPARAEAQSACAALKTPKNNVRSRSDAL